MKAWHIILIGIFSLLIVGMIISYLAAAKLAATFSQNLNKDVSLPPLPNETLGGRFKNNCNQEYSNLQAAYAQYMAYKAYLINKQVSGQTITNQEKLRLQQLDVNYYTYLSNYNICIAKNGML